MKRLLTALGTTAALAFVLPASAQDMPGMPGMKMPAPAKRPTPAKPTAKKRSPKKPATKSVPRRMAAPAPDAMPGMAMPPTQPGSPAAMPAMPGMETKSAAGTAVTPPQTPESMPGMDMSGADKLGMSQSGTALPAGDAPAPMPPMDRYADRYFPASEMNRARAAMMRESGGQTLHQVMFNLAEVQARAGGGGYRWDGQAFVGGDINRLWLKTEGEGAFREGVDKAELQALYSRAIDPYFNLQAGIRRDFGPGQNRTYATVGFEGLAPYMFEVGGAAFLSNKGELFGRLEGYYDQRITQRLILQPRIELNLSAQDVPEIRLGSGLTDAEFGLRLRYDITRRFAPYVGVSYEARTGRTAKYARAEGKDPTATSFVAGVRFQF